VGLRKPNRLSEHIRTGFSARTCRESVDREQDPQLMRRAGSRQIYLCQRQDVLVATKGLCIEIRSTTKWALPRQHLFPVLKEEPEPLLVTTSASEAASVLVSCHLRDLKQI
jgi:hypothetical protein